VAAVIQEVNSAYQTGRWKPILYLKRHNPSPSVL